MQERYAKAIEAFDRAREIRAQIEAIEDEEERTRDDYPKDS